MEEKVQKLLIEYKKLQKVNCNIRSGDSNISKFNVVEKNAIDEDMSLLNSMKVDRCSVLYPSQEDYIPHKEKNIENK